MGLVVCSSNLNSVSNRYTETLAKSTIFLFVENCPTLKASAQTYQLFQHVDVLRNNDELIVPRTIVMCIYSDELMNILMKLFKPGSNEWAPS